MYAIPNRGAPSNLPPPNNQILRGGGTFHYGLLVWYVMSGSKPLFNLSVYFDFFAFMTFLGPK